MQERTDQENKGGTPTAPAELAERYVTIAQSLVRAMKTQAGEPCEWQDRCGALARAVATELELDATEARNTYLAGALRDIGKLAIAPEIIEKPGPLAKPERKRIRKYPQIGAQLLAQTPLLKGAAELVRACRERPDGQGYPRRLRADEIPTGAGIVAVCSAYCAMTEQRPYREARSHDTALAELRRCSGSQFDANVVEAFDRATERSPALWEKVPYPPERKRSLMERLLAPWRGRRLAKDLA